MRKKRVFQKGAAVLIVISVVMSCMLSATGTAIAQSQRTLTYWDWHGTEIPEVKGVVYKKFEKEHPDVKLVISSVSWPDSVRKTLLAAQAGKLPDVLQLWAQGIMPELVELEGLLPLDAYVAKEGGEKFLANWYDWAIPRYKGKIYALMEWTGVDTLWWNKTIFDEAGVEGPPKNWDELASSAQKLTAPPRQFGLGLNGNDPECLFCIAPFIYQNEGRVGRINGKIQVNSSSSVEAIEFVLDLINKYKVVPSFTTSDYKRVREMYASGKVAMVYDAPWSIPQLLPAKPESADWRWAVLPKGRTYGTSIGGWDTTFAITTNSKDQDLAWEFIKFLTNEENNGFQIAELPYYVTGVKAVGESKVVKNSPALAATAEALNLPNAYNVYEFLPPQVEAATDIFRMELQSAVVGEKSAQEAMDAVAAGWEDLFNEWERKYGK